MAYSLKSFTLKTSLLMGLMGVFSAPLKADESNPFIMLTGLGMLAPEPHIDFQTLVIPIKRADNLILIEAQIDTLIGDFILDTGAPYLVLNKTYFRNASVQMGKKSVGVAGSHENSFRTQVDFLDIQGLSYHQLSADVAELGHIENRKGVKILGLLGVNLFTNFELVIDLQKNVLYIHQLDKDGKIPAEEVIIKKPPLFTCPLMLSNNTIFIKGSIGGKKLRFCLDTGAEMNVLDNQLHKDVLKNLTILKRLQLVGAGGYQVEALAGVIKSTEIGGSKFVSMRTLITNLHDLGEVYGWPIDGMLGYDFIGRGIISINFVTKELRFYEFEKGGSQ